MFLVSCWCSVYVRAGVLGIVSGSCSSGVFVLAFELGKEIVVFERIGVRLSV